MDKTLIIMPAYNVADQINKLLDEMGRYRNCLLVIDDGSCDSTGKNVRDQGFQVIRTEENRGISYSISRGIQWAKTQGYDHVILMDSDGQHDPKYIPRFAHSLKSYDFVYGKRFGDIYTAPSVKLASNMLASLIVSAVWNCNIHDIACGFKAFRLNKGIEEAISTSEKYSVVYDVLFYCLNAKLKMKGENISTIYPPNEMWYTRTEEIMALLISIKRYAETEKMKKLTLDDLEESVQRQLDFHIILSGYEFFGFYIAERNGYIIQSKLEGLLEYTKEV